MNICKTNLKEKLGEKNYYILTGIIFLYFLIISIFSVNLYLENAKITNDNQIKQENIVFLNDEIQRLKEEKEYIINNLDLETDNSIYKFVTSSKSFDDKSYIPENLVSISSNYVYDAKGGSQLLRNETNIALQKMAKDFYREFDEKISVVSAYRSYLYQKGIKDRGCPDNLCAKAGYSEHQSGLVVDLWEASSKYSWNSSKRLMSYYNWLDENAANYGFHNTYQKGLDIDGYEIEPWHWRYLGVELATYLKENNITIAEFYNSK